MEPALPTKASAEASAKVEPENQTIKCSLASSRVCSVLHCPTQ